MPAHAREIECRRRELRRHQRDGFSMDRTVGLALAALALLAGCAAELPALPSFYRSLATPAAELDASAAQSMISGYRRNHGLDAVALDPTLMRLAAEQSRAMAQRGRVPPNPRGARRRRPRRAGR